MLAKLVVPPLQLSYEGHGAIATLERPFTRVGSHMMHKGHLLRKGARAQVALKWSLASVNAEVDVQATTCCVGLVAVGASVCVTNVHGITGARVTSSASSEQEMLLHLSGRRVIHVLPSTGACKRDNGV